MKLFLVGKNIFLVLIFKGYFQFGHHLNFWRLFWSYFEIVVTLVLLISLVIIEDSNETNEILTDSGAQSRIEKYIFVFHFMGLSSTNYNLKHTLFSFLIKYPMFKMEGKNQTYSIQRLVKHKVEHRIFVFLTEHTHDK